MILFQKQLLEFYTQIQLCVTYYNIGELLLTNWKPVHVIDVCSDRDKTVVEILGQLRVPATLKIPIRYVYQISKMIFLNHILYLMI